MSGILFYKTHVRKKKKNYFFSEFFLVLGKSHSADICKRGHLGVFEHPFFGKIGKNEGGTLWRHLKNLRKKVSLSRKQLLEAFEKKYLFKKYSVKVAQCQKPKKRSFRPIKRFLQTENCKKMQGVPFDDIRKFSKKSRRVSKKTQRSHLLYFWKNKNIMV